MLPTTEMGLLELKTQLGLSALASQVPRCVYYRLFFLFRGEQDKDKCMTNPWPFMTN